MLIIYDYAWRPKEEMILSLYGIVVMASRAASGRCSVSIHLHEFILRGTKDLKQLFRRVGTLQIRYECH